MAGRSGRGALKRQQTCRYARDSACTLVLAQKQSARPYITRQTPWLCRLHVVFVVCMLARWRVIVLACWRVSVLACWRVIVLACWRVSSVLACLDVGSVRSLRLKRRGATRTGPITLCWLLPRGPRCLADAAQPCTARGKNSSIRGCRACIGASNGCCKSGAEPTWIPRWRNFSWVRAHVCM